MKKDRYKSYESGIGKKIIQGEVSFDELEKYAKENEPETVLLFPFWLDSLRFEFFSYSFSFSFFFSFLLLLVLLQWFVFYSFKFCVLIFVRLDKEKSIVPRLSVFPFLSFPFLFSFLLISEFGLALLLLGDQPLVDLFTFCSSYCLKDRERRKGEGKSTNYIWFLERNKVA